MYFTEFVIFYHQSFQFVPNVIAEMLSLNKAKISIQITGRIKDSKHPMCNVYATLVTKGLRLEQRLEIVQLFNSFKNIHHETSTVLHRNSNYSKPCLTRPARKSV